ncbi:MAG TPA: VOC family protein [bacterium]|nr:VOC family protein [bacterium]
MHVILPFLLLTILAPVLADVDGTPGEETMADKPRISVNFIYNFTSSLEDTRHFYTDLLGMEEMAYKPEWNYLCYKFGDLEFMFFGAQGELAHPTEYADQPGWPGGTLETTSWSVQVPESDFAETVGRLKAGGVPTFSAKPEWRVDSYWGFTVRDPNGVTVEVYTTPQDKPVSKEWTD